MSIIVNNITKLYGTQKALDSVSLEIEPGQIVGLLGPNGAGKSTLMKILSCYLPPSSGSATVCGFDVMEQSIEVRKRVGYLPENNPLYTDPYVGEYLSYVAGLYHLKAAQSRIKEIIGLTGLEDEKHKKIGSLSKGYRQRVGLAQALIHDPSVLILDEPTSGLDPSQLVEIRQLIRNISFNKTVMISTHIMQEVEALCDRIIIISRGKILATDSPANIKKMSATGSQTILVEFEEAVVVDKLLEINGVNRVEAGPGRTFILRGDHENLRALIFRFAVTNGYTILTLNKQETSLENVFLEIIK